MTPDDLREWVAWHRINDSREVPEITEWDSEEMITRKLQAAAERKRGG